MAHGILNPVPVALKWFKISNTLNLMFTSALGAFLGKILGFLKIATALFQQEFCTTAKLPSSDRAQEIQSLLD